MHRLQSITSLLGRSRVLLLGVFVLALFTVMGFLNLAMSTAVARAERDQEAERVERLREQNVILQQDLNRAQRDEHLGWLAWDYFGRAPAGVGVIERMEQDGIAVESGSAEPGGWWDDLLRRMGLN